MNSVSFKCFSSISILSWIFRPVSLLSAVIVSIPGLDVSSFVTVPVMYLATSRAESCCEANRGGREMSSCFHSL